ncbi:Release factor glutamine methyltransferase [Geodia barretti]|uniref:Release factor glutamine methyltransferase n=1 Tax=Geodia barretti TaxID=519541 RepID=A0AA35XA90_GEOBA|nr:Release factor glutamine methyltransferase [Geodia barretti]
MTIVRETIRETHQTLEAAGIPDARLEAEVMVMTVMPDDLAGIIGQRLERIPLAYILGYREFYGINVVVTPDVLIPRPETEGIVEHTLFMALMGMETRELSIADVGTGSGAIAVNLAIHLPAARIYAVDISEPALDVAAWNIRAHSVADRIRLGHGDLLEPVPESVDLIVANLPYIPTDRIPTLQPEVQCEPGAALDGGPDGLDLVRRLLAQAPGKLNSPGIILLELDPEQFPAAEAVALQHFPDAEITAEQDLSHRDRIMVISRP